MKKQIKTYFFSLTKTFESQIISEAMVTLGNSIELPALVKKLGFRLLSASFPRLVKFSGRLRQLFNFITYLLRMRDHHGAAYVVNYLKSCQLAVQKRIALDRIESLRDINPDYPFPRLTSSGLPKVIPLMDRRAILSGSPSVIRWWLTIFSIYRVIKIPGNLKLGTITEPFSGNTEKLEEVSSGLRMLIRNLKEVQPFSYKARDCDLLFLESASPTYKTSWMGWFSDPSVMRDLGLLPHLRTLVEELRMVRLGNLLDVALMIGDRFGSHTLREHVKMSWKGGLGQLSIKEEAAGKVRVFALVDIWTQSVLKPIHDMLFAFLKSLPNDATFDQHAAVKRCMLKVKSSKVSFGYDLSAATDRLPIDLQVAILSSILGDKVAFAWKSLLVDRSYILSHPDYGNHEVKYSVGQPMGALSSWAMLAVTHHLLVQYAARIAGSGKLGQWYDSYELLGDDIVIFEEAVAKSYLSIMDSLGVGINLSKSVVAGNDTFEFAKVTGHKGENVSAISWKMFISQNTFMGRANIAYSLLNKDIVATRVFSWLKNIVRHRKYDQGDYNYSLLAIFTMYANSGKISFEEVIKSLYDLKNPVQKFYKAIILNARMEYIQKVLGRLVAKKSVVTETSSRLATIWNIEEVWAKVAVWRPIQAFVSRLDVEMSAQTLTNEIIDLLAPIPYPDHLRTYNFDYKWSDGECELNALWLSVYVTVKRKHEQGAKPFEQWDRRALDLPLDSLINFRESMDRFNEGLALVDRAVSKELGSNVKNTEVRTSPLASVKWLLKMRSIRPWWTLRKTMYDSPSKRG